MGVLIWIAFGWTGLLYIAIREKWDDAFALGMMILLLFPAAVAGPCVWAVAIVYVPTSRHT